ncbi:MAG: hypothetical protein ACI9DF_004509 [Verrucomicrobiales bacterium]|jgi:hypothetical protein
MHVCSLDLNNFKTSQIMKHTIKALFGGGLLSLLAIQSSLGASTLLNGTWQQARWVQADAESGPNSGVFAWVAPLGTSRVNDDTDVFTTPTPSAGFYGVVEVVDIGASNDQYNLLDFTGGLTLVGTTNGFTDGSIFDDPDVTFGNDATWSQGSFAIGAATSFKLEWVDTGVGQNSLGSVYLRYGEVPEPSSSMLALLGLAGLMVRRRR